MGLRYPVHSRATLAPETGSPASPLLTRPTNAEAPSSISPQWASRSPSLEGTKRSSEVVLPPATDTSTSEGTIPRESKRGWAKATRCRPAGTLSSTYCPPESVTPICPVMVRNTLAPSRGPAPILSWTEPASFPVGASGRAGCPSDVILVTSAPSSRTATTRRAEPGRRPGATSMLGIRIHHLRTIHAPPGSSSK